MRNTSRDLRTEPRYLQLRATLLGRIRAGSYGPGARIPTEPEIAEEFGVSRMTANKAILSLVSDGWLYRRKRAGTFVADSAAEQNARSARPVVAVPEPERTLEDEYFQGLYWALNARISSQGGALLTVPLPESNLSEKLEAYNADPLILLAPTRAIQDQLLEVARNGTSVLALGTTLQGYGIVAVDSDNMLGSALAVNHLAELGHREILFLGAYPEQANTEDRLRGFKTALGARGLPYRPEYVVMSAQARLDNDEPARSELVRLLTSPNRPTAVFAAGSHVAMGLMALARSLDLRVPEELSIVAYDDPPFVSHAIPPLTTVRQPLAEMATFAADLIYSSGATPAPTYTLFDPSLVVRGTTSVPHKGRG